MQITINISDLIEKEVHSRGLLFEKIITDIQANIQVECSPREKPFEVNSQLIKICYHTSKHANVIYIPDLELVKKIIEQVFFELPIVDQSILMHSLGFTAELPKTAERLGSIIQQLLSETEFAKVKEKTIDKFSKNIENKKLRDLRAKMREDFLRKYNPTLLSKSDEEILQEPESNFLILNSIERDSRLEKKGKLPWESAWNWKNLTNDQKVVTIKSYFKKSKSQTTSLFS